MDGWIQAIGGSQAIESTEANLKFADCAHSTHCAPYKHHYDECVERVTQQQEDPDANGPKEDCVEECKLSTVYIDLLC